jgi:hypothetical protein
MRALDHVPMFEYNVLKKNYLAAIKNADCIRFEKDDVGGTCGTNGGEEEHV